jgi:hypothetical protein
MIELFFLAIRYLQISVRKFKLEFSKAILQTYVSAHVKLHISRNYENLLGEFSILLYLYNILLTSNRSVTNSLKATCQKFPDWNLNLFEIPNITFHLVHNKWEIRATMIHDQNVARFIKAGMNIQ